MEFASGYVKLFRKLVENPVWVQLSPAVLKVLIACIFRANWRPAVWYDGQEQVQIPRGAFISSYAKMAEFCNLSVKQIRSAFNHLENLGFMACTRAQRWTLVSVINYETYQCNQDEEGTIEGSIGAGKGQDEGRQRATDEEVKNKRSNTCASVDAPGAGAPLVLVAPDANEKPKKPATPRKPYADVLEQVARAIHGRHPNAHGRRDLGVAGVEKKLEAILKHKRTPAAEAEAYLRRIDQNHTGACQSEAWRKDGGQYAKGLRNWLAPREGLYEVELQSTARKEPVRLMA